MCDVKFLLVCRYVLVWKKVDGQWKIYTDITTTNLDPTKSHDEL